MNTKKILLIDYDPTSVRKTVTTLANAGYDVEVAKDGVTGLEAFERIQPSLVLVEAMLPRKHGFEVCQEIKAKPGAGGTPVLITTAVCRGRKYREDALQTYGCDEYIEKPIADDELVSMVRRCIDHADRTREEIRQELSGAIDSAAAAARASAAGVSDAIESMSEDELEAKIDSMLLGDGPPLKDEPGAPDSNNSVVAESPPAVEPASDVDGELERRVAAMADVQTPVSDEPEAAARPEVPEPPAEAPVAKSLPVVVVVLRKGLARAVMLAAAAMAAAGLVGFLASQQGWFGAAAYRTPARGELFQIDKVDRPPVPVRFEQPVYDELARRMRQEGDVLIAVLIDEKGVVVDALLTQEIPNSRLNESALLAAQAWVYRPAIKDGVPVRVWKTERVVFSLE